MKRTLAAIAGAAALAAALSMAATGTATARNLLRTGRTTRQKRPHKAALIPQHTHPLSSLISSAAMKSGCEPNNPRYRSYSAKLGKLNSASALSLAPSLGKKYP